MDSRCQECKGKCCMGTIDVYKSDAVFGDPKLTWESHDPDRGYDAIMQIVYNRFQ